MTDEPVAELRPVDRVGDTARITRALRLAVREALWQHKIAENPVAVWRNGRVEWIPPEEIPVENPRGSLVKAVATDALKPWREVVTPHEDVASGRYQQAEFAADLWQVYLGEGSAEYREPVEFFRRTFLTESLQRLLVGAVQRVAGQGGDPVVQLQTNFGGGKTHSMLALYHLFSGVAPSELAGVDGVLAEAGVKDLPKVRRIVLVGNKISPGNPVTKPDGTVVRTLWGELAYQLRGKPAYARIAKDDENATSPGDVLRELFVEGRLAARAGRRRGGGRDPRALGARPAAQRRRPGRVVVAAGDRRGGVRDRGVEQTHERGSLERP